MVSQHIRRCSTSLVIKDVQIKTSLRHHFIPTRMAVIKRTVTAVGKDVGKVKSSNTAVGNVKWYRLFGI